MPLKQLRVIEKIKFLVSNSMLSKKQIVAEVEGNAEEHRQLNQRQEREDDARVDHARKELDEENEAANYAHARIFKALVISIAINFILLVAFALAWYFLFYK
ncbi:MAG: hypothetical protein PHI63_02210 [Patescibacteria group bacterium]|nr:hypothetical protein [Patescibacteria group bacterium]